MLLSAGVSSDTLYDINRTIVEGRRLTRNVRILAFGVSSGTLLMHRCCHLSNNFDLRRVFPVYFEKGREMLPKVPLFPGRSGLTPI